MAAINSSLKHKLAQFLLVLVLAYLFFRFGIPALALLLTGTPAPVPTHLLWAIYMPTMALVMLLFVSANEAAWREFKAPLRTLVVERERRGVVLLRQVILVALPLLAGLWAFFQVRPSADPPAELRSVHPAPPDSVTVDGEVINLRTAVNPFRGPDGLPDPEALAAGKAIYGRNCVYCHGDALDSDGLFASALRPRPADFTDPGTIAQLQESYLFWRIAQGGPGLPPEGKGWNSAMPAWEGTLSRDEIWQVILYLYDATGQHPRQAGE
ncbi:MAG: cytochrome c [Chloroflexi bacterium]|nr:cytochrome c [Chloroflexota bacterium]MCI0580703.1 cytochrome c [Chloroflexota bacterium]MCI0648566.1 cytochrome c [Chloroflexota bacterium]MCI0727329.1 cytochrome c [Chloroflexota bacterium]